MFKMIIEEKASDLISEKNVQSNGLNCDYSSDPLGITSLQMKYIEEDHLSALNFLANPATTLDLPDADCLKIGKISIEVAKFKAQLLHANIAMSTAYRIWKLERGFHDWIEKDTELYVQMRNDMKPFIVIANNHKRLKCNAERRLRYAISRLSIRELNY
jgi:hypothetical protein